MHTISFIAKLNSFGNANPSRIVSIASLVHLESLENGAKTRASADDKPALRGLCSQEKINRQKIPK